MSLVSRLLFGVGLALVLLACSVDAHAWMSNPKPRGQYLATPKAPYMEYGPASHSPNDENFVCRGDPASPKATWVPLTAGKSQDITITFNALHVGDCFVYLSYDGDKPTSEQKWFKIWEQHACKDNRNYSIPIPSYLPSGEHVVFRWEWYALHIYPTVEYFTSCFDATVTGSTTGVLPSPQVNIPGHLPVLSGDYADNTNNYWWPWDNQPMFFTGPALATIRGQAATSAPTSTKAPTATNAPAATNAPTIRPPNAEATTKPISTAAPTVKAATSAPAATASPTAKAATAAPKATAAPAATTAPSNPTATTAPSQSVKLVVGSSTTWWLSITPTGHRSSEISKMEVMDSNAYTAYTPMTFETWSRPSSPVWTFQPQTELKMPIMIKASLPSGSSLIFTINRLGTVVDSGSVFP